MDNTGSMSSNNNIATLRTAAKDFVNIMFDRAPDPALLKLVLSPIQHPSMSDDMVWVKIPMGRNMRMVRPLSTTRIISQYTTTYNHQYRLVRMRDRGRRNRTPPTILAHGTCIVIAVTRTIILSDIVLQL